MSAARIRCRSASSRILPLNTWRRQRASRKPLQGVSFPAIQGVPLFVGHDCDTGGREFVPRPTPIIWFPRVSAKMPAIRSFTITYHTLNERGTFSEGDTVTGQIILDLIKEVTVESFYLKFKGDANVRWKLWTGRGDATISSDRRYFKSKTILMERDTEIPEGFHIYDFSFTLPQTRMPSSFTGDLGSIVYKLEAKLTRIWRLDRIIEKEIPFVSKYFSNPYSLRSRHVGSKNKEMGFISKGNVHMGAMIEKKVYVPGETIVIVVKITNSSSNDLVPKFALVQNVVYRAQSQSKEERNIIQTFIAKRIGPKTEMDVKGVINISRDQVATIQNCDIILVEYHIKVFADTGSSVNPAITFPVIIIPPQLDPGLQPSASRAPEGSSSGASTLPTRSYPASPRSSSPRSLEFHQAFPPACPDFQTMLAHLSARTNSHYTNVRGFYSNPVSLQSSPHVSPFSSSPSSPVLHPDSNCLSFHPIPQVIPPSPSAPPLDILLTDPANNLPSAPDIDTNFLAQSDEAPPSYSFLFPSSLNENPDAD